MNTICHPEDLVLAHTEVQMGTFLSCRDEIAPGLCYISSSHITDFFWNHAWFDGFPSVIGPHELEAIRQHAASLNRVPALFSVLASEPEALGGDANSENLITETWMSLRPQRADPTNIPDGLSIAKIPEGASMQEFLGVFRDAYGPGRPEDPGYSCLPETYLRALITAAPHPRVKVVHLVGHCAGQPVAIASVFCKGPLAGLYNVGTIHSARRQHFGRALSLAAIQAARDAGCSAVFLQTEPDSILERMYQDLGFERQFLAGFYLL